MSWPRGGQDFLGRIGASLHSRMALEVTVRSGTFASSLFLLFRASVTADCEATEWAAREGGRSDSETPGVDILRQPHSKLERMTEATRQRSIWSLPTGPTGGQRRCYSQLLVTTPRRAAPSGDSGGDFHFTHRLPLHPALSVESLGSCPSYWQRLIRRGVEESSWGLE